MPEPSQRAQKQAQNLGLQLTGLILSMLHEGIETRNRALIAAAHARIDMVQHENVMFRKVLGQLGVGLHTFVSKNPIMMDRLSTWQWAEIKPEDYGYIAASLGGIRKELGERMAEMLQQAAQPPARD